MPKIFNKIVEIIPDDIPGWANQAMKDGNFFTQAIERVEDTQKTLEGILTMAADDLNTAASDLNYWMGLLPDNVCVHTFGKDVVEKYRIKARYLECLAKKINKASGCKKG